MALTQTDRPITVTTPLGDNKLIVRSVTGTESMSGLYKYVVEFNSEDHNIDFKQIVGKPITIEYPVDESTKHHFSGIVGRFLHLGKDQRMSIYQAEVHPWFWLMTMNAGCQIFQNKSALEIIKQVFGDLGFADFTDSTSASYGTREYCVQYNETSFAFVSRLMEEEGMFYFFKHDSAGHKLILADASTAFAACPGAAKVSVQHHGYQLLPSVWDCQVEQQVTVGQYKMDDYNFETPATDLLATASGEESARSVYEYPGNLLVKGDLEARTKIMLDACEAEGKVLRGASGVPTFRPGYKFTLENHARDDANAEWVVRQVSFSLDQNAAYSSTFEAFPSAAAYRPQRKTARPRIAGAQTAEVVGKSGEEIWTDKYGRIKVKFHWDLAAGKDENSSCWIRVSQRWAGKNWGMMFIPRIGQEVVVSFLEGDPDRPLITGSVYNATQTVPYTLPSDQTKSTMKSNSSKGGGGFNELRFEDKKDSEEVFLHAQKDYNITVLNNQTSTVKKNRKTTVEEENDDLIVSKGNRTIKVDTGNETHEVKGTRSVKVTGNETHTDEANFDQEVKGNFTLKVTGNITIEATGSVKIKSGTTFDTEAGTAMTQKSGTDFKNEAGTNMTNKAAANMINEAGSNLSNEGKIQLSNKGAIIESKASGMQTVDGGGMLALKGGLIKLN